MSSICNNINTGENVETALTSMKIVGYLIGWLVYTLVLDYVLSNRPLTIRDTAHH